MNSDGCEGIIGVEPLNRAGLRGSESDGKRRQRAGQGVNQKIERYQQPKPEQPDKKEGAMEMRSEREAAPDLSMCLCRDEADSVVGSRSAAEEARALKAGEIQNQTSINENAIINTRGNDTNTIGKRSNDTVPISGGWLD